jgi:hypothetical protein
LPELNIIGDDEEEEEEEDKDDLLQEIPTPGPAPLTPAATPAAPPKPIQQPKMNEDGKFMNPITGNWITKKYFNSLISEGKLKGFSKI